ncbi:hypothetical protein A2U19_03385 [Dietzia maris]|nr:hypothetical protein A2U19_03385 [Dietzia maris]
MRQSELRVVVDEVHGGDQVLGDCFRVRLVKAAQVATDVGVEVGGLDIVGQGWLIGAGCLTCVLTGAAFAPAGAHRPIPASGDSAWAAAPPVSARGATTALTAGGAGASIAAGAATGRGPPGTARGAGSAVPSTRVPVGG